MKLIKTPVMTGRWHFISIGRVVKAAASRGHLKANAVFGRNNRGSSPRTEEGTSPPHSVIGHTRALVLAPLPQPAREQTQQEKIQRRAVRAAGEGGGSEKHALPRWLEGRERVQGD